jgi:hypothetical protein
VKFVGTRPSMIMGHFMADLKTGNASAVPIKAAAKAFQMVFTLIMIAELDSLALGAKEEVYLT